MSFIGSSSRRSEGIKVVMPKGIHKATIVWLHGHGENGSIWSQKLADFPLPNIKWICPTAPKRHVSKHGGCRSTAWFDEDDPDDDGDVFPKVVEGLDESVGYIANLLSAEPSGVKLGIGGYGMGAACALHSANCLALGRYGNGSPYPIKLDAIVGLSGWLPVEQQGLSNAIQRSNDSIRRAATLPIMLCHGVDDKVVPCNIGARSSEILISCGFNDVVFRTYEGVGHRVVPKELRDICQWLNARLVD